jgi:hypothetical protein
MILFRRSRFLVSSETARNTIYSRVDFYGMVFSFYALR